MALTHPEAAANLQTTDLSTATVHKRTYQACIPCRRRKVRCDLGPVDEPHDPPCVRCRRESKECYFSATRRKRKADGGESDVGEEDLSLDDYAARNGRRKSARAGAVVGAESLPHQPGRAAPSASFSTSPLDGYSLPGQASLHQSNSYSINTSIKEPESNEDQEVANDTAAALFQSPINVPGDALHLLLKASNETEDLQRRDTASLETRSRRQAISDLKPAQIYNGSENQASEGLRRQNISSNLDPAIADDGNLLPPEILKLWSRLRFVRAGWFTAKEAISYILYFDKNLSPLTPISLPAMGTYGDHPALLNNEPVLTVTILTIASRYLKLPGPGGQTRSFMIHEKLWSYLQSMVTRMAWGQEQFGGGFCGAGTRKLNPMGAGDGGLRSLGTIESLLLLTEFHPRSIHFPPRDDDDDILAPDDGAMNGDLNGEALVDPVSFGESAFGGFSEPALRSDRMSWTLIGTSLSLAYELGIFGSYSDGIQAIDGQPQEGAQLPSYRQRAVRIERLLYIFITQASGRFGLQSMYTKHANQYNTPSFKDGFISINPTMLQHPVDQTQNCWVQLMSIMKDINNVLFVSKDQTTHLVQGGTYITCIQQIQPKLYRWHEEFQSLEIPQYPRIMLSMEYHYINLYVNSLALQAVLEQWTNKVNSLPLDSPQSPASSLSSSIALIYSRNERYIKEVIKSSRTVLEHVVYELLPDDYLKHVSVRTYFRIISAAMFLLKTFALGGKVGEVDISLRLLDQTIDALRTSVVDDVHLCLRIADLLERLTFSIRHKFVRLAPQSNTSPNPEMTEFNELLQAQYAAGISRGGSRAGVRYVKPNYLAGNGQDPQQSPSYDQGSPGASDIHIMPPLGNNYSNIAYAFGQNIPQYNQPQPQDQQQQQRQNFPQDAAAAAGGLINNNGNDFSIANTDDWLTLDLNPLLDSSGNIGTADNQWFVGAFGPETHNNLEVLGKLVNDPQMYQGDLYGNGGNGGGGVGMGF